jgi:hypothetical protein
MMADAVIFSDIMAHLVSRISAALTVQGFTNTRVSVLADESPSQVILRRDGGNRKSKTIQTSVVGVSIYAANYADAETLSNMVEAILDDLPDGNPIVSTSAQSSIQDVSDLKGQRRFLRWAIDHRGENLTLPN